MESNSTSNKINIKDIKYPSNLLSLSRALLVIPFWLTIRIPELNYFLAAIGILTLGIITDMLDGALARKLNQITELGKVMDPIADKLCLGIGGLALVLFTGWPWWLLGIVVGRDLFILVGGMILLKKANYVHMANKWGKANTMILAFTGMVFILGKLFVLEDTDFSQSLIDIWEVVKIVFVGLAVFINIASFLSYLLVFTTTLKNREKTV